MLNRNFALDRDKDYDMHSFVPVLEQLSDFILIKSRIPSGLEGQVKQNIMHIILKPHPLFIVKYPIAIYHTTLY